MVTVLVCEKDTVEVGVGYVVLRVTLCPGQILALDGVMVGTNGASKV